jgi:cold shock CspA family protein
MTNIDFGKVERYIEDRGFGFVSRTFAGVSYGGEIFFHIKVVKRTDPKLAQGLGSYDPHDSPYFWYEFERAGKGTQVVSLIDPKIITERYTGESLKIIKTIKEIWVDADKSIPGSIRKAAPDIIPSNELIQLEEKRLALEEEKSRFHEDARRIEAAKQKETEDKIADKKRVEEEEFQQLVIEISSFSFTHSKQVSEYIVRQKLGHKYKNISGILKMEMNGEVWKFNGGFPPKVYAKLCCELRLENQGSRAKPLAFISYKDINGE